MTAADKLFNDIESIASQPTERKNPALKVSDAKAQPNAAAPLSVAQPEATFFEETPTVENADMTVVERPLTKEVESSGRVQGVLIGDGIEVLFALIEMIIFVTSMNSEEKEQIIALDDKPESEYTEKEKSLNRRFIALSKKHEKNKERIPLTKREQETLEQASIEYTRITGKSFNPQLILWTSVGKILINRSMDIFL